MYKHKITKQIVKKVADLIKIFISEERVEKYSSQLEVTLDPAQVFENIDLSNTPITSQTIGTKNVFREDIAEECLSVESALQNANAKREGYVVVKKVI